MTRRLAKLRSVAALAAIIALGACSSSPPPSAGAGSTSDVASLAPADSLSSSSIPGLDTNADPALAAEFPKTIDGQPVTNIQTFHFLQILTATGAPKATIDQFTASASQAGINPRSVALGTAQATVGGKSLLLQALRVVGSDANRFIKPLEALAQQRNVGVGGTARAITLSASTVGGKNVQVASSADLTQYYYPKGDTVFILNNVDATVAATILAALP